MTYELNSCVLEFGGNISAYPILGVCDGILTIRPLLVGKCNIEIDSLALIKIIFPLS